MLFLNTPSDKKYHGAMVRVDIFDLLHHANLFVKFIFCTFHGFWDIYFFASILDKRALKGLENQKETLNHVIVASVLVKKI